MKGFTLIEIIVSFGIILILAGFGFTGMKGQQQKNEIKTFADRFMGDVQALHTDAYSGKKPLNLTGCTDFALYRLTVSSLGYITYGVCNEAGIEKPIQLTHVLSPEGISFDVNGTISIDFVPLVMSIPNDQEFILQSNDVSQKFSMTLKNNGYFDIGGFTQ
jgi:prepilin-type N-terminal cleavage/methylation domain-containing protein